MNITQRNSRENKPSSDLTNMATSAKESVNGQLDSEKDNNLYVRIAGHKFNKVILLTHFNIFLYAACFWIQQGVVPYLSKKLEVDPVTYGYLQTVFALVQLAGGPLFGRFGDLFGSRAAFTLAFAACALSYLILGFASTVTILFISRLPSIFMHCMQAGQMIVTDLGESDKRADAMGKLGLSYGVGMVIGPLLGGVVIRLAGEETAAFVAFAGSVFSIVLVQLFIPKHTKKNLIQKEKTSSEVGASSVFDVKKFLELVKSPGAMFLLLVRTGTGFPIGIFQSMFPIVAIETFKLPADQNGYIISYIGITSMAVQGIGIGIVTKRFTEDTLLKASCLILAFAYFLLSFVKSIWQLCVVLFPLCIGLTTQTVVISSALTRTVSDADTGAMIGVNMAVNSLIRTVSPTIGGYMLSAYGFPSFGWFGTFACSMVALVLFLRRS